MLIWPSTHFLGKSMAICKYDILAPDRFFKNRMIAAERAEFEAHLSDCERCTGLLDALKRGGKAKRTAEISTVTEATAGAKSAGSPGSIGPILKSSRVSAGSKNTPPLSSVNASMDAKTALEEYDKEYEKIGEQISKSKRQKSVSAPATHSHVPPAPMTVSPRTKKIILYSIVILVTGGICAATLIGSAPAPTMRHREIRLNETVSVGKAAAKAAEKK